MADPRPSSTLKSSWPWLIILLVFIPVLVSVILHQPVGFDPVPLPAADYSFGPSVAVLERNDRVLAISERVGEGLLPGPEDLAYDDETGYLYTGCYDGWIRRVNLMEQELKVEDWVHVGGRPLGIVFDADRNLVVAEADKGLLVVRPNKTIDLLTDEAEGIKFRLTDGVDVTQDGLIYFTDASYKFNLAMNILDILEGRPHGRLMSFDPSSNMTVVLVRDLYFANGVSLSPDQSSLIFCETIMRRCRRYHIQGEKIGRVEKFIENLPGLPDNIRFDKEGHYWIGLAVGRTWQWDVIMRYPLLRKLLVIIEKFIKLPYSFWNSGVLKVSLDGQKLSMYSDPGLSLVTGGLRIGKHLYYGSLVKPYISRIDLTLHAAKAI